MKYLFIVLVSILCSTSLVGQRIMDRKSIGPIPHPGPSERAEFPGGQIELENFINTNIISPKQKDSDSSIKSVTVEFTVNIKGKIEGIKIIRGIDSIYNNESLRLITLMPDWTPGKNYTTGGEMKLPDIIEMVIDFK